VHGEDGRASVERRKNLHGGRNVRFACGIENVRVY
jgi:hypothetical protein